MRQIIGGNRIEPGRVEEWKQQSVALKRAQPHSRKTMVDLVLSSVKMVLAALA